MTFSHIAAKLAADVSDTLSSPLQEGQSATVEPLLTNKAAAAHKRQLVPGTIALRLEILVNEELGDLGKIELFVPVSKAHLKRDYDMVLGSVLRHIKTTTQYRANMLARLGERVTA